MRPGEAVMELAQIGFRFRLDGAAVKVSFVGQGTPDTGQVAPLIDLVKAHKDEVRFFLKCNCPRCGGVVFCPDYEGNRLCLSCDWNYLLKIYPGLAVKQ